MRLIRELYIRLDDEQDIAAAIQAGLEVTTILAGNYKNHVINHNLVDTKVVATLNRAQAQSMIGELNGVACSLRTKAKRASAH